MIDLVLGLIIIVVCIACEGFFSGTETAMVSLDRTRIKALAEKGSKKAALICAVLNSPEKFFSTTLLGTNMVAVLSNAIATFIIIKYLGAEYAYVTILIMSPLILLFGEIVPKTVYRFHAEKIVHAIIYPIRAIATVLSPFVFILSRLTTLFMRLAGIENARMHVHTTREDLENYLSMWNINSRLKTAEKKMIERIFDFGETDVEDIMIRLVNTKGVEVNEGVEKAVSLVKKTGHSRIPVYSDYMYNVIGIIHAFDLLTARGTARDLRDLMRPARYVPNSMPIDDLLKQMRTEGNSIAVVVNEYGGTIGIVTIEDILEEVVGEIYDEHDKEERLFVKTGENKYRVNARMEMDELNDLLKLDLPKDDYETLAGFLLKHMEKIPRVGDSYTHAHTRFIIKQADKRSIKEVIIIKSETTDIPDAPSE